VDGLASALPRAEVGVLRRALALTVVALAAGAAGGWLLFERADDPDEDELVASGWNTCTNPVEGFSVNYPAGWYTDHPTPEFACMYFDPRRFELEANADWEPKALQVTPVGRFTAALSSWTEERTSKVLEREELELGGRRAVRLHTEVVMGSEHAPAGTRVYLYVVDAGPRAVVVQTTATVGVDYGAWRRVVDRAVRTLRSTQRGNRDVVGADVVPPQLGLPEPVAGKRARIWAAARKKDYEALGRLVDPEGFEYTFGGPVPGGPTAYWRQVERTTPERPIETLAAILELPYVHQPEHKLYVWPFAFTRKASTLSPEERQQLAEAIGEDALRAYEQVGDYLGYRAAIDEDGNWVFYVAGD
jgi:hypothetical protein